MRIPSLGLVILLFTGCGGVDRSDLSHEPPAKGPEVLEFSIDLDPASAALATRGDYSVTQQDVDDFLITTVPGPDRPGFLRSPDRIGGMLDRLLVREAAVARFLEAIDQLDENEQARLRYEVRGLLLEEYQQRKIRSQVLEDYEVSAKEIYLKDPLLFVRNNPIYEFESILIPVEHATDELPAINLVMQVQAAIDAEQEFRSLIQEFSQDPSKEENHGIFSGIERRQLLPQIAEQLDSMEPQQISGPVRTSFGWHFLKLISRVDAAEPPFEDVRDRYIEYARQQHEDSIRGRLGSEVLSEEIRIEENAIATLLDRYGL